MVSTDASAVSETCAQGRARIVSVKWANPTEELTGIAKVCHALLASNEFQPRELCVIVPNQNWGRQIMRALYAADVPFTSCLPCVKPSKQTLDVLSELDRIAAEEKTEGIAQRGLSLAAYVGARDCAELAHGLMHVTGTEDAACMAALLREQLAHPTMPAFSGCVAVMQHKRAQGTYKKVFILGCVNGLVPGRKAFEADEDAREAARVADREAFIAELASATDEVFVSFFTKADAAFAEAAHIRFARKITEGGQVMAMIAPSDFLQEAGSAQPSTIGGQALLRSYGLN